MSAVQWICHLVPRLRAGSGGAGRMAAATKLVDGRWQAIGAAARAPRRVARVAAPAAAGSAMSGGLVLVCYQTGWPGTVMASPLPVAPAAPGSGILWGPSSIPAGFSYAPGGGPSLFAPGGPGSGSPLTPGLPGTEGPFVPGVPVTAPGAVPDQPVPVPEPAAAALFITALLGLAITKWSRRC